MPPSSHMQPRSSTRMPPPPASGGGAPGDKPLLHVGPWQEYALSALLARMRAQSMAEVMQAMATVAAGSGGMPGGADTPVSGAVSPVDSYVGSMSSARSERSAQSAKSASSTRTSRTDPSSWSSSSGASANTALFRRARNLKYKGPNYDKPWKSKVPRQKTTKEIEVERRRNMYAQAGDAGSGQLELALADGGSPQPAQLGAPLHGRRAPHAYVPPPAALHGSPAAHRANAVTQPVPARAQLSPSRQQQPQLPELSSSPPPRERDSLDDHLRSPPRAQPMTVLPRTPGTPKGDEEVDDLLNWADGIDLANISQELG